MTEYVFNDHGSVITVGSAKLTESNKLKPGFYSIGINPEIGFFLQKEQPFTLPAKTYGSYQSRIDRAIRTYMRRSSNTGVLLEGTKGSGKTVMAKQLANQMMDLGFPVIIINSPYSGEGFNRFIEKIGPCVIVIDEFEKVYSAEKGEQANLLTLFDGTINTNNLILLTVNSSNKIISHFHGRPGRIYLRWEFDKLERDIVTEVMDDLGLSDKDKDSIYRYYAISPHFTFDILMTLIDEMTNEDGDFDDILAPLNLKDKSVLTGAKFRLTVSHVKFPQIKCEYVQNMGQSMLFAVEPYSLTDKIKSKGASHLKVVNIKDVKFYGDEKEFKSDNPEMQSFIDFCDELEIICLDFNDLIDLNKDDGSLVFEKSGWTVIAEPMVNERLSVAQLIGR